MVPRIAAGSEVDDAFVAFSSSLSGCFDVSGESSDSQPLDFSK
jgi:hypothetical protein